MKNKFLPIIAIMAIAAFLIGMYTQDPTASRTPNIQPLNVHDPIVPQTDAIVKFVDSLNGANDTVALRSRGYIPKRGPLAGPPGTLPNWFQGNPANWNAFNGPTSGYVSANYNCVTSGTQDLWLILPQVNTAAGDTISFYERSVAGNTFPDSTRVYYAANGDTVPGSGSFVELGKFLNSIGGAWVERRFVAPTAGANGRWAINYRVANGGPPGANGNLIGIDYIRILGPAAPPSTLPDLIYYKYENNPSSSTVLNCAIPGVGTSPASFTGLSLTPGGQFDSCITGAGTTSAGVTTGWNLDFRTSSWTISMWVDIPTTTFGYLFGDGGNSFRCFNNGAAGTNGLTLRGTGITNVDLSGFNSGPTVVHFVYDSAAAQIRAYKNGVLSATVSQTLNLTVGTGFKVGGYTTNAGFTGKMDEFRIYRRALTPAEVLSSWNSDLGGCGITGIIQTNNQIPNTYSLDQNYPNPFNPVTNIKFGIPQSGNVKLVVFDILGREVATLVNEFKTSGNYVVDFEASTFSSGVYFYRIESGSFIETKKMLLVK